jgi:hypothetical protein
LNANASDTETLKKKKKKTPKKKENNKSKKNKTLTEQEPIETYETFECDSCNEKAIPWPVYTCVLCSKGSSPYDLVYAACYVNVVIPLT